MTIDPQRRRALLGIKLAALVRDHAGEAPVVLGTLAGGAALTRAAKAGVDAWVLADDRPERFLGPAMLWARRAGAGHIHLLVEESAGLLARRAAQFTYPPTVWQIDGRAIHPAEPTVATPSGPPPDRVMLFVELIRAAGAEPVVEHGVLVGEVAGLEVCRALIDPFLDVARLEVGVGAHDREAFLIMHGDVPTEAALADVVRHVAQHRRPGARAHPLNRLGAERLLRARLITDPSSLGLHDLVAAPPPVPRTNLKDPVPCIALARDDHERPVVVAFSSGIDLDLVPFAADARVALGLDDHELLLAVPARDAHAATAELAARLRRPARIVGI